MNDTSNRDSLYSDVMEDPVARHMYFNVTKGILAGTREDPAVIKIKEALDELRIPYCYNNDTHLPRPIFLTKNKTIIGAEAIIAHAKELDKRRSTKRLCEYGCCY